MRGKLLNKRRKMKGVGINRKLFRTLLENMSFRHLNTIFPNYTLSFLTIAIPSEISLFGLKFHIIACETEIPMRPPTNTFSTQRENRKFTCLRRCSLEVSPTPSVGKLEL